MYATSLGGDSSNDETALAGEQVARVFQSHCDLEGDDIGLVGGISIETRSRRWWSIETSSASSESHTISNRTNSRRKLVRGKGASGGAMQDDDILIDIDKVFARPKVLSEFNTQRRSLRPWFPPHQARADAPTRTIDRGIKDTHLQHGLKDHPSAPT